jgi:hypothetical protein
MTRADERTEMSIQARKHFYTLLARHCRPRAKSSMDLPAMEVRFTKHTAVESWEYVVRAQGVVLAASNGDDHYSTIAEALKAALLDVQESIRRRSEKGPQS